jgi:membrane protein implicated in regulation of membrane protease activity
MGESLSPGLLWFLVGLVCVAAEILLPGFVIIFFGVGAWITAICCWTGLTGTFDGQLVVFLLSTLLSLVLFRKRGKKMFSGKVSSVLEPGDEMDDYRGQRATVVADIAPGTEGGRVEYHGTVWQAEAQVPLAAGTAVRIVSREGLRFTVQPIDQKG